MAGSAAPGGPAPSLLDFLEEEPPIAKAQSANVAAGLPGIEPEGFIPELHGCSSCGRYAFPEPTRCYWCRGGR